MKFIQKIYPTLLIFSALVLPKIVFAEPKLGGSGGSASKISNPIGAETIQQLLTAILKIVVAIGAPIIVFFIIYAGFKFVTAQGNEGKIREARDFLMWTLVGAVILLGAEVLARVLESTINQLGQGI